MTDHHDQVLSTAHGQTGGPPESVGSVIARLLKDSPVLVWCEPRPQRHLLTGFTGLWLAPFTGLTGFLDGKTFLEEARLFWENGAVHLVADHGVTRWAAFWEGQVDDPPAWLAPMNPQGQSLGEGIHRREQDILTQRDFRRYGLPSPGTVFPTIVRIVEYRRGTQLVFWNLKVKS